MSKFITHQGDVLIEKIDAIPSDAKCAKLDEAKRAITAHGETSGHMHALHGSRIQYFHDAAFATVMYAALPQGGVLNHETEPNVLTGEHKPIPLEAGTYRFTRQTEAPWGEAERVVAD